MKSIDKFVFRSLDTIGYPDALEDEEFLGSCFVDSGYLDILRDCRRPERVVIGRTGAGKSALLERLLFEEGEERAKRFMPETLSLSYVSNSTVLTQLLAIGVNLDLFFNLLWKHVFCVELIRWRYKITDAAQQRNVFQNIVNQFRPTERRALEYLRQYGDAFWIETDQQVVEFTKKFEDEIRAKLNVPAFFGVGGSAEGVSKASQEEKHEVRERAQKIINEVQLKHLTQLVGLVKEILDDPARRWYIIIDRLDENWVDNRFKALLTRALLDTVRSFREVPNLKIVVAFRQDLIDRVFTTLRGSGAQQEKYQGVFLHVRWTPKDLAKLLDQRINHLVKSKYSSSQPVGFRDVFPRELPRGRSQTLDFILDRTLLRPRDAIAFVNSCIKLSDGKVMIAASTVIAAEGEYSRGRLEALYAEWDVDYPNLNTFVELLKNKPEHFRLDVFSDEELVDFAALFESQLTVEDDLLLALKAFMRSADYIRFTREIIWIFYRVGLLQIKLSNSSKYIMSLGGESAISSDEINEATRASVHIAYRRALGIGRASGLDPSRI